MSAAVGFPSARELAGRHALHRTSHGYRGNCPACGYRDTLSVSARRDGSAATYCFNGCTQQDLQRVLGCARVNLPPPPSDAANEAKRGQNHERAMVIWRGSEPARETIVERYLTSRGLPHLVGCADLRFRADTLHPDDNGRYPAMIALVRDAIGEPLAIHRTYLKPDGSGKANVKLQKATLGPYWGGAVRLDPLAAEMVVAEGVETAASAGKLLELPAWTALSAGNLEKGLVLPVGIRSIVIAADRDAPGERAAIAAASRWRAEGRIVCIARPHKPGSDFNDVLQARLAHA